MKTNQNMIRPMGDFKVIQRTKDGMFNATDLIKQWNQHVENQKKLNTQNFGYLKKKDLDDYFNNKSTKEFIEALVIEENLSTTKMAYLKSRGNNGGTWMHPILFIDFAMWLNPKFKVKVIKFVYDEMIKYRNEAGDAYRELSQAIQTIVPKEQMKVKMKLVSQALNWIVFNGHEKMLRNKNGDENKMRELSDLERKVASLISENFIKNFDSLIDYLRRLYMKKGYQPCFAIS